MEPMAALEALFLATKEPLEEKEVVSYFSEMGIKEGAIDKSRFDERVKTKMFGDVVVYYPSTAMNRNQKKDTTDEKLLESLKAQLQSISSEPTIEEMSAKVRELKNKKDGLVIEYWAKNNERISEMERSSQKHEDSATTMNMKVAQLVHDKINLLHSLNDAKDETHRLFGLLAEMNQCTVKDIYSRLQCKEE